MPEDRAGCRHRCRWRPDDPGSTRQGGCQIRRALERSGRSRTEDCRQVQRRTAGLQGQESGLIQNLQTARGARTLIGRRAVFFALAMAGTAITASSDPALRSGAAAFGDWRADSPGVRRLIRPGDLPAPYATPSSAGTAHLVPPPVNTVPQVPAGFSVQRLLAGLENPRLMRAAPNGDIFIAETGAGRIRVLRTAADSRAVERLEIFASGLDAPFGLMFYPLGSNPRWLYVAYNNSVVRFAYSNGDLKAQGKPETVIPRLSAGSGGHTTRDLALSPDGSTAYVSVGSSGNVAQDMPSMQETAIRRHEQQYGLGAAWGSELQRAAVLSFSLVGPASLKYFATGIRNCVGMAIHTKSGDLWCAVNERDALGDDLVPDYVTRVSRGAFYGWPWYYIGAHQDPRHPGARPGLRNQITIPDVLLQAHSAALGLVEYHGHGGGAAFPANFEGDLLVALHGSWNRSRRTGYKLVRIPMKDGVPSGEYQD